MRTLIRTCFNRLYAVARLSQVAGVIALCTFAALAASAQSASRGHAAQAELHIKVRVVPAVIPPHRHHRHDDGSVTYDFALDRQKFSVIEEVHPLPQQDAAAKTPGAYLRTTTIVMK